MPGPLPEPDFRSPPKATLGTWFELRSRVAPRWRPRGRYDPCYIPSVGRARDPEQRRAVAALVVNVRGLLRGFLEGRVDRDELARFARDRGSKPPRGLWGAAGAVLDSIAGADDLAAEIELGGAEGEHIVREGDVRAYLSWLTEGEAFFADEEPFAGVELEYAALVEVIGIEPVRWWWHGLGWFWSVEFCSPATGRMFGAIGSLDHKGQRQFAVRKAVHDTDPEAALADLIETLGLAREKIQTSLDLDASTRRERF